MMLMGFFHIIQLWKNPHGYGKPHVTQAIHTAPRTGVQDGIEAPDRPPRVRWAVPKALKAPANDKILEIMV